MIEEIRNKDSVTRQDIADLLSSIGSPGQKRAEKKAAVESLHLTSPQGYGAEYDLDSYREW